MVSKILAELDQAVAGGQPADVTLAAILKRRKEFGSRDRRLLAEAIFSYFRWRGWFRGDRELSREIACGAAYYLDAGARHPAVDALLERAAANPADFVPAGHENLARKSQCLAAWLRRPRPPRLEELVPAWLPGVLCTPPHADAAEHAARCITSFQTRPPVWFRAAPGREDHLRRALERLDMHPRAHTLLRGALASDRSLSLAVLRAEAACPVEIQDLASQCVGRLCDPLPGQNWWDVCAGAGGKSLHLAALAQDRGRVIATDPRPGALRELDRRRRASGLRSIVARAQPAADMTFDGVLVDAPCSGIGTWSRNPDARWRTAPEVCRRQADAQLRLLHQAAPRVRPNGRLVYAVCTLTTMETLDVRESFLSAHPEFALEPFLHPLDHSATKGEAWIWPWAGPCDGMYILRMRKL